MTMKAQDGLFYFYFTKCAICVNWHLHFSSFYKTSQQQQQQQQQDQQHQQQQQQQQQQLLNL